MTVKKTELAEDRTNWAEDRTLMASERTFASWLRTALAAIGVGLGMQVVFDSFEPTWAAKLISSLNLILAEHQNIVELYGFTRICRKPL